MTPHASNLQLGATNTLLRSGFASLRRSRTATASPGDTLTSRSTRRHNRGGHRSSCTLRAASAHQVQERRRPRERIHLGRSASATRAGEARPQHDDFAHYPSHPERRRVHVCGDRPRHHIMVWQGIRSCSGATAQPWRRGEGLRSARRQRPGFNNILSLEWDDVKQVHRLEQTTKSCLTPSSSPMPVALRGAGPAR